MQVIQQQYKEHPLFGKLDGVVLLVTTERVPDSNIMLLEGTPRPCLRRRRRYQDCRGSPFFTASVDMSTQMPML